MSELQAFLSWGAQYDRRPGARDQFGRPIDHNTPKFPYGTIAYWVAEYEADRSRRGGGRA